jgi:hypothetical protein
MPMTDHLPTPSFRFIHGLVLCTLLLAAGFSSLAFAMSEQDRERERDQRLAVARDAANAKALLVTTVTSYSESVIHLPGLDAPAGLDIKVGLKTSAGEGFLQGPVFWRQPANVPVSPRTDFCCGGWVQGPVSGMIAELHPVNHEPPQDIDFTYGVGAQPVKLDGTVNELEYRLFPVGVATISASGDKVCFDTTDLPKYAVIDETGTLQAHWNANPGPQYTYSSPDFEKLEAASKKRGDGTWESEVQLSADLGPALLEAAQKNKSLLTVPAEWKKLMTGLKMESVQAAGYEKCDDEFFKLVCYCPPKPAVAPAPATAPVSKPKPADAPAIVPAPASPK